MSWLFRLDLGHANGMPLRDGGRLGRCAVSDWELGSVADAIDHVPTMMVVWVWWLGLHGGTNPL